MATKRKHPAESQGRMWALPRIMKVTSRLATYEAPRIFFVGPERREVRRAVEITVDTDGPIPARALSPAISVGNTPVTEMETVGPRQFRFYAIEPGQLREGAVIAFGWPTLGPVRARAASATARRVATPFRFRISGNRTA